ncbi:Nucleolar protein 58 [Lemmus lemmus]
MVGELVGARLIAHAGSLLNLAKHAASTIQILGTEKALFRALKSRRDTPKYGLIYHASLVGQTSSKHKGKISRMLAAKTVLAIQYDAFGEDSSSAMGVENRAKLEARLRILEDREKKAKKAEIKIKAEVEEEEAAAEEEEQIVEEEPSVKKKKKDKKKHIKEEALSEEEPCTSTAVPSLEKKKKKKKRKKLRTNGKEP